MKKWRTIIGVFLLLAACGKDYWRYGGEGTGIQSESYPEPAPFGMLLIPKGSIRLGINQPDVLTGLATKDNWSSFDAFWMDQTEVTNARYRQFVYWVRDSLIRERLYDPAYGGNELYKITEDRYGEPVTPYLDWSRSIPWNRPDEEEQAAIESVFFINPVTGEKQLDPGQMNFHYEWYDHAGAATYRKELEKKQNSTVLITKDTAYIDENGQIINRSLSRPLSGYYDFLHTYIINIYPDESCWITDFEGSDMERYIRRYFHHPDYDHYPVTGVSWEMAQAFCAWRTLLFRSSIRMPEGYTIEPFRLPTEGEWEYAARGGNPDYIYPWGERIITDEKGCLPGNFKPGEGNYVMDGHIITSRVRSYPPNRFGLYDMAGNVSEWTSSEYLSFSYSPPGEVNPYQDSDIKGGVKKRRIVKGGSWKDLPPFVRSDIKTWEYQDKGRSYTGFRCVRNYAGSSGNRK